MKKLPITFALLLLFAACKQQTEKQTRHEPKFEVHYLDMDLPIDNLQSIGGYRGYILGLLFDGSMFVLDTAYRRVKVAEDALNSTSSKAYKISFYGNDIILGLHGNRIVVFDSVFNKKEELTARLNVVKSNFAVINDTAYLISEDKAWRLQGDYELIPINRDTLIMSNKTAVTHPLVYTDKRWNVYYCGAGEFGGNIFFENRQTKKVHSLPGYFQDIVFHKNTYHLIQGYVYGGTGFYAIKDPSLLPLYQYDAKMWYCCNCDSLHYKYFYEMTRQQRNKWEQKRKITQYYENMELIPLRSFITNNQLYTLCSTDTLLVLIAHTDTSAENKQSIPKMNINTAGQDTRHTVDGNRLITAVGSVGSLINTGSITNHGSLGLYIIDSNKIYIYEGDRTWKEQKK